MLDNRKMGRFIAEKRKSLGMTQQQLADMLSVSFQAVSKWEMKRSRMGFRIAKQALIFLTQILLSMKWENI